MRKTFPSIQAWIGKLHGQAAGARGKQFWFAPAVCLVLCGLGFARTRERAAPSFTIDLDQPYSRVVAVVEDVARSSVIRGTFEYAGDEQLEGAQFESSTRFFPAWTGAGKVFFKVRNRTLAPKHFLDSNDVGTVALRYVVQEDGANATRLVIDAVFVENAGHHGHPSDGYVETCEFAEIGKRLKESEPQQVLRASSNDYSSSHEGSPQPERGAQKAVEVTGTADIRHAIADQQSQLAADTANLRQLEAQERQLRASEFVRISAERAELKASPYSHARVLAALKQGQEVTVVGKSAFWFRVRSEDGQEGWVSHTVLEAQP